MKKAALIVFLAPGLLCAQGVLGSKSDPVKAPAGAAAPAFGMWEMGQTVLALALVAALLKWGLPWILKKFNGSRPDRGEIKVKETASVGSSQIHLVEVAGRTLLVGAGPQSISLILDLSAAPEPASAKPEAEAEDDRVFFEHLDARMEESDEEPVIGRAVISRPMPEAQPEVLEDDEEDEPGPDLFEQFRLMTRSSRLEAAPAPTPAPTPAPAPEVPKSRTGKKEAVPFKPRRIERSALAAQAPEESPAPSEPSADMTMDQAVALIASAKKRAGIKPPAGSTDQPETRRRRPAKAAGARQPSDDDILAALDRISRLTR